MIVEQLDNGSGHIKQVRVARQQRALKSDITDGKDCDPGTERPWLEEIIPTSVTATEVFSLVVSINVTTNYNDWNTGYTLAESQLLEGELPTGLTLGYSGTTITLTGTATETGVFTPTIRASNATGVSGEFTVTITIS